MTCGAGKNRRKSLIHKDLEQSHKKEKYFDLGLDGLLVDMYNRDNTREKERK
jgi:hypothetical protein